MNTQTPVLLLTGYLGSGKTTLVNRILSNRRGIKFAVIVNDIGEVNIDADLIQKGGIVGQNDDSLVALQNGCICCTLKMDLVKQITDIISLKRFDYIVIEASGICEPDPIAQTICSIPSMGGPYTKNGIPRLDCVVTVVDALRMQSEFACGDNLMRKNIEEDDLENLVIVLLNKASEISRSELNRLKEIVRALQPQAHIIECDYGDVDLDKILNTNMFDFEKVATSATWIHEIETYHDDEEEEHDEHHHEEHHHHHDDDDEEEHEPHHHHHDDDDDDEEHEHHHEEHGHHHHHHHHHHDEGEAEEYGIGTFVYYRRRPFNLSRFDEFVANMPKSIIRAKGICYFKNEYDRCYLFEQAGKQLSLKDVGLWFATMTHEVLEETMEREPGLRRDWDVDYGDRMQKLVFIGQHMDKEAITQALDACLTI